MEKPSIYDIEFLPVQAAEIKAEPTRSAEEVIQVAAAIAVAETMAPPKALTQREKSYLYYCADIITENLLAERIAHPHLNRMIQTLAEQGIELTETQGDDLVGLLVADGTLIEKANGRLRFPQVSHEEYLATRTTPQKSTTSEQPARRVNITRAIRNIDATPEMKRAKELAINKVETKKPGKNRRKRGSRGQGRNHGKTKSFEQLLAEAKAQAPKST